jgi:glycine betaine/proline transport system permease protein
MASVLYALPVAVHYTDLGLRAVPTNTREAATSFGTTWRQRLTKVELPLAGPQLMTAVNQTIMLVLAMVVIAGLVGGGGLGLETVRALRRSDSVGTGFEAGIAIVLLAAMLDRMTTAIADRLRPPPAIG